MRHLCIMNFDVTILTESRYVNPVNPDWYDEQVLTEDRLVMTALEKNGLKVQRKDWADPDVDWSKTKTVLFRSTWDYFNRFEEFSKWLKSVSTQTVLINPAQLIHWNIDKRYLEDLEKKGVNCVETIFIPVGTSDSLRSICEKSPWDRWVLKPTVSGAARHTYLLEDANLAKHEAIFAELIAKEEMMLQPFINSIVEFGELSLMVMDGKYTHAVHKIAKKGDFRVQDDFGGTVKDFDASPEQISFAEKAVKACDPQPMYARVDVVFDNANQLAISELELIEPELWFRQCHEAAAVLANGITRFVKGQD
ncbi:MAG: hypothetical protein P8H59_05815 [Flavobacteriales bacterium]|nr:hypothetical protein [Flavobacteriales bacterium]